MAWRRLEDAGVAFDGRNAPCTHVGSSERRDGRVGGEGEEPLVMAGRLVPDLPAVCPDDVQYRQDGLRLCDH